MAKKQRLDNSWKDEPIPSPEEIDEWVQKLEQGQATTGFLRRLVLSYRKLYYDKVGKRRKR